MKKHLLPALALPALAGLAFINCSHTKKDTVSENDSGSVKIETVAGLKLKEISGLEYVNNTLWGLEDSGNKASLYTIDPKTGNHTEIPVSGVENKDWEDIAAGTGNTLYIGDFGNNDNKRSNLAIHTVKAEKGTLPVLATTAFSYPEQTDFPPKKKNRNFDCEAFFEFNGSFYLFSKNRSVPSNGVVLVHKVANKNGTTTAEAKGSFTTCDNFRKCAIAGADISPDGKTVALISGDKLWLIRNFKGDDFANGTITSYNLGDVTQKESVVFTDNTTLYAADERSKKNGGKLYRISIKGL